MRKPLELCWQRVKGVLGDSVEAECFHAKDFLFGLHNIWGQKHGLFPALKGDSLELSSVKRFTIEFSFISMPSSEFFHRRGD